MRFVRAAALIVATGTLPQGIEAQFQDYGTHCIEAPFRACASLSVSWQYSLDPFGAELTTLDFRLSNRQGSPGFDYPGHTGLSLFTILDYATNTVVPGRFALAAQVDYEGNADGFTGGTSTFWDQLGRSFSLETYSGAPYPLFGCDPSPVITTDPFYAGLGGPSYTCYQGWLIYSITMPGTVSITDETRYRLDFVNWTNPFPGGPTGSCFVGETCVAAVPEPGTMILLGTGIGALALARRRRRRRP